MGIILGFLCGGIVGCFIMCLCQTASIADDYAHYITYHDNKDNDLNNEMQNIMSEDKENDKR